MALKSCIDCGHKVSLTAPTCPNCGRKNPAGKPPYQWTKFKAGALWATVGNFGIFLFCSFTESDHTLFFFIVAALSGLIFGLLNVDGVFKR